MPVRNTIKQSCQSLIRRAVKLNSRKMRVSSCCMVLSFGSAVSLGGSLPARTAADQGAEKLEERANHVPVYFATDRRQAKRSSPSDLSFKEQEVENLDKITFGVIDEEINPIAPEPKSSKHLHTSVEATGVPSADTLELPKIVPTPELSTQVFDADEMTAQLHELAKNDRGVIVYVHGCCMGFHNSAEQAAETGAWMKTPIILYDWGSSFGGYAGSLQAAARSQERFNSFMDKITSEIPPEKVTILGFSLGNQLIVDYCLQKADKQKKFKNIILARPDLDLFAFKSHVPKILACTSHAFLYVAKNDFILHCSGGIRKLLNPTSPARRVGVAEDELFSTPNLTVLDVSNVDPLHTMPNEIMAELSEKTELLDSKKFEFDLQKNGIIEVSRR